MLLVVLGKRVNLLAQEDLLCACRALSWSWERKRTSLRKRISYALLVEILVSYSS